MGFSSIICWLIGHNRVYALMGSHPFSFCQRCNKRFDWDFESPKPKEDTDGF